MQTMSTTYNNAVTAMEVWFLKSITDYIPFGNTDDIQHYL
jgi:hypothetical protein